VQRVQSVDVLRAVAIITMVFCHFPIYLSTQDAGVIPYFIGNHVVGDWPAPFFLFLVGLSQVLSGGRGKGADTGASATIDWRPYKRGAFILFAGVLLGLALRPSGRPVFAWDVLPLIGVAVMVLTLVKRWPSSLLLALCLVVFVVAPLLRGPANYASWVGGQAMFEPALETSLPGILSDPPGDYRGGSTVGEVLLGLAVVGEFPFFPWIIFPLVGMVLGRWLIEEADVAKFSVRLLGLGAALAVAGAAIAYGAASGGRTDTITSLVTPLSFYPLSPSLLLLQLGVTFLAFAVCRLLFDGGAEETALTRNCGRFSRYSLTIYIFHYLVMFWPVFLADYLMRPSATYLERVFTPWQALGAAFVLIVVIGFVIDLWDRRQGIYSLEWMLARLTPKQKAPSPPAAAAPVTTG